MTYDELYPNLEPLKQAFNIKSKEWEDVIKGTVEAKCWHCNRLTYFVSISFEAPICSPECEASKWDEYFEALKESGYEMSSL